MLIGVRYGGKTCNLGLRGGKLRYEHSVKETYKKIMSSFNISTDPSWSRAWHKAVPSKVSCLAWRVFQNRVATKDNLFKRGVIDQGVHTVCW